MESRMQKSDGMNYAPVSQGIVEKVCAPGEFRFGVIGLEMCIRDRNVSHALPCAIWTDPAVYNWIKCRY